MTDDLISAALERVARDVVEALPGAERLADVLTDLAAVYSTGENRNRLIRAVARPFSAD
jgi:hypothetical protein